MTAPTTYFAHSSLTKLDNHSGSLTALQDYEGELELMRAAIESGDAAALKRMFEQARRAREKWLVRKS